MLSSRVVAGPQEADGPVVSGGVVHWVLVNDGTVPWPAGTTLRLVGGPVLLCPLVEVPEVSPGQTVDIELEVQKTEHPADVFYSLVTHDCQPFGEIAHVAVCPRETPAPAPKPIVVALASTMDNVDGGLECLQGELKTVEWTLANIGSVSWPDDVSANLIFNTPGFEHLPGHVSIPALDAGMTAEVGITALMPERAGQWKAIWAVTSPTQPEFGELLIAEFSVGDFPFMDWMIANEPNVDTISDAHSQADVSETKKPLSMAIAMQQHLFLNGSGNVDYPEGAGDLGFESMGKVSGLAAGTPWVLEMALTNDGAETWPEDSELKCCFGSGFGCPSMRVGGLEAGQTILLQVALVSPDVPSQSAWVLTTGQACFGPVAMLDVV
eukprot:TRINITY_DN14373_c0_g1_i1.p1 TRINITY_DN14373_c0_g1~~TRINITY_DN14373_c0_g1_i1.p1  ORF type:complete len:381 (+),score=85.23 TRINITY_DN14373_c0_g1_i1:89-1231(+)